LDKWPDGKVELFQNLSNQIVNSYWEKNLPKGFRKPDANASNQQVTEFMTNKYVHKKWANNEDWNNDPAWLFENKPKKFAKYIQYYKDNFGGEGFNDQPEPVKSYKNRKDDSSDDERISKKQAQKKPAQVTGSLAPPPSTTGVPRVAAPQKAQSQDPGNLLDFDQSPAPTSGNSLNDIFSSNPTPAAQDDGFSEF
jgi:hypothetical protein